MEHGNGSDEMILVPRAELLAWAKAWQDEYDPNDGADCVTPFDAYLLKPPVNAQSTVHVEVLRHMKGTIKAIMPSEVAALDAAIAALSAPQPAAVGEEIMVNAAHDVYTLPLQPSGLSSGPRFVVHVPAPEQQPAAPVLAKHQPCGCVICTCEDEQQCQGCGAKHCGNRADHPPYAVQQPAAVDDLMNAWREAFIAERATRYREGGMKIEQARIHAETDAARIYALAAAAKGVGND